MKINYAPKFYRQIDELTDVALLIKIERLIEKIEQAGCMAEIPHIKKLRGHTTAYRIRIGDYRIGFFLEMGDTILFSAIARRSIFYRLWP